MKKDLMFLDEDTLTEEEREMIYGEEEDGETAE